MAEGDVPKTGQPIDIFAAIRCPQRGTFAFHPDKWAFGLTEVIQGMNQMRKVRLGTTAIILPYRNPKVTAKQLSTIDTLSGGRLIFGCAAGWSEEEFGALGVDFKNRGAVSDAYLRMIKRLWTEPRIDGLQFEPRPLQKPHPPIWVGGNSKRGIRRAVELGNYWHPTRPTAEEVKAGKSEIRNIAERFGRNPAEIGITVREPFKIDERLPADQGKPFIGPRSHVMDS